MTLFELIEHLTPPLQAARLSHGHGVCNARDEAAWLVLHLMQLPPDTDLHGPEGALPVPPDVQARAQELLQERIHTRKPLAYLLQHAWLQGVPFYVDERAIVPRSLIAEVIASGSIDCWLSAATRQVLDLCTGNGSLAVLAALAWPDVHITAADISPDALAVARINVDKHNLQDRIRLVESDGLAQCPGPYDLILCNPPYVNAASMAALPPEYRAEPALALAAGADGMDFIRPLLAQAPAVLSAHGVLALEIGHERDHFEAAFPQLNPVWLDTSAGSDQVLLLTRDMLDA